MSSQEPPQNDKQSVSSDQPLNKKSEPAVKVAVITGIFAILTTLITVIVAPLITKPKEQGSSPPILSSVTVTTTSPEDYDLTGEWKRKDGATFYIRQVDSKIWWYGQGPGWSVVLYGTWDGKKFQTDWADVPMPGKNNRVDGESSVYIIDSNKLLVSPDEYYLTRK